MKIGWAYIGLAALLVISGSFTSLGGNDLVGDSLLLISIPIIYIGSKSLANAREKEEAEAEADAEAE